MGFRYLVLLLASQLAPAGEITALFDGRSLDGWTADIIDPAVKRDDVWSVRDGVIVCKGRPPGVLRTEKEFADYELTVEWRWPADGKPGNSGVLVHASKPRDMFVWPRSVEIQLRAGDAGDFWTIGETLRVEGVTPQGRRWIKRQDSVEKESGEWNTMTVRCEGDTLVVHVNGTLMNEAAGLSAAKGAICLQSEGAEVHFRKVELRALEGTAGSSEKSR